MTLRILLVMIAGGLGACGADRVEEPCLDCPVSPRSTPADVAANLQASYKHRDIQAYAALLADDFQFWLDPASRPVGVPEFWGRTADSAYTACLFAAPEIADIRISLTYSADSPDVRPGHAGGRKILVTDTFLEVDRLPDGGVGEVTTFRVDGARQQLYLRKGRSPADTLAGSSTAREWFLVDWYDLAYPRLRVGGLTPASEPGSWGRIKVLFQQCSTLASPLSSR